MSDSNDHAGFSFQISETPPPARARSQTPLADLVLDMGDFGHARDPSPLPPRRQAPEASAWIGPPVSAEPHPKAASASPAISPAAAAPPAAAALPAAAASPVAAAPPAAAALPAAAASPVAAASLSPAPATAPLSAPAPSRPPGIRKSPSESPPIATAPKIKKITFPGSGAPAPTPDGRKRAETKKVAHHADERRTAKTRFSQSISAREPRPPLDSEPEVGEEEASNVEAHSVEDRNVEARSVEARKVERPEMAPPEDLPSTDQELLPSSGHATWNTDTPSAREVWRRAQSSWRRASQQAVALGGQGLRAGKALAESASDKVRERLRQASDERSARAHLQSESEARSLTERLSESAGPPCPQSHQPPMAGRVILGLARSLGRKAAAPASAVAAAAIVYFVGSHLLGTDASVALSKTARGPEVPDLGTLDAGGEPRFEEQSAAQVLGGQSDSKSEEKTVPSGPPPMETEVAEMPKGMSWPGKGLIEVVTSQDELVYVDGVFTGRGPLRRIPVSPGEHEVSIRMDGKERKGSVQVVADKNTRAVFKGP